MGHGTSCHGLLPDQGQEVIEPNGCKVSTSSCWAPAPDKAALDLVQESEPLEKGPCQDLAEWEPLSEISTKASNGNFSRESLGSTASPSAAEDPNLGDSVLTKSTRAELQRVRNLVEEDFDILAAKETLDELCTSLRDQPTGKEQWSAVLTSDIHRQFSCDLDLFRQIGQKCCDQSRDWFSIYQDSAAGHTISGCFDEHCSRLFHYRACVHIPASLPKVMAVANEVDLGPLWQPALVGKPQVVGRRTALKLMVHSQMSLLGGLFKVDTLNDVKRFVHREGGFLAEYIQSADEHNPNYCSPKSGFRRLDTEITNIWASCGPERTVLIQVGKLRLAFPATRWLVNSIGGLVGSKVLGSLTRNALRAAEPGSPWEPRLLEDRHGLYRLLAECTQAPASIARGSAGAKGPSAAKPPPGLAELECFFRSAPAPKEP